MKFIHIADVHLGAHPDPQYAWSENRAKEIWESFVGVIEQVKKEKTELLLIAGDLFHGQPLLQECIEVNYLLEQIPDTAVVLIAGNHDHITGDSAYLKMKWAPNVIGLWGGKCQSCYIKSCNTYVYGLSYHSRERKEPIYNQVFSGGSSNFSKEQKGARHILLAHGGDETHIPIRFSALAQTDFDYIALGHIHQPRILVKDKMAYAGSLEPIDRTHLGVRGYISGEITGQGTSIRFVPFAKREYKELTIHVSVKDSNGSLMAKVRSAIEQYGEKHIYRIQFEGCRTSDMEIQTENFTSLGNVVEVTDYTEPGYDFAQIEKQYTGTAVGAYINSFLDEKKELTQIEKKALYYGLRALLKAGE